MLTSLNSGRPVFPPEEFSCDAAETVCITGHRQKSIRPYKNDPKNTELTITVVRRILDHCIDKAAEHGYRAFFSGLADGIDLWAAEHIIKMKMSSPDIKLYGAMPFLRHSQYFNSDSVSLLRKCELHADQLVSVNSDPMIVYKSRGVGNALYRERNYFMVENSSALIGFFDEANYKSGTYQTISYARRCGRTICCFNMTDVETVIDAAGSDIDSIDECIRSISSIFVPWD